MMNRTLVFILLASFVGVMGISANVCAKTKVKTVVEHVHPLNWWAGMKNPELQILLHGIDLGDCDVTLEGAQQVELKSVNRCENTHYLLLYVDTKEAPAQQFDIVLKRAGKSVLRIPYELREREQLRYRAEGADVASSFDAADVVYLLMPDRFATGTTDAQKTAMYKGMKEDHWGKQDMDRRGGDLAGMIQHLDYLQDLGITAIWPTPTLINDMSNQSYHGYAITDYYETDPRFGTNKEYKTFVQDAHKKGIKVIKDLVFNHCGSENFLFADKPSKDWFSYDSQYVQTGYKTGTVGDNNASQLDKDLTVKGWFTSAMPDLNGAIKQVADYLIQASKWWVEYAGVDGFRQDTYPYNDFNFMRRWCMELEAEYPGFNVVGETWINNNVGVSYWQKDSRLAAPLNSELRTVMDFPLMYQLSSVVDEETDEWDHGFARLYALLSQDIVYAAPNSLLTFLANHDTDRFQHTKEQAQNVTRYKQALALLLTLRGIPQLYYGDEIGMYANKSVNDGALRETFPGGFPGDANNAFTAEGRTALQNEYHDFTRTLLQWRKGNVAVAYGNLTHYSIRNGVYVYSREYQGSRVTVLINGTSKQTSVPAATYAEVLPQKSAYEVITGKSLTLGETITLQPREIMILDFDKQ